MPPQTAAALCISIDLELLWGNRDHIDDGLIRLAEQAERPVVRRLLKLAERHDIPMTWAVVGRVFDDAPGLESLPGPRDAWFAPELVDAIRESPVAHDIGSHSHAHLYFDQLSDADASLDLGRDVELRRRWGLPMRSWVFPCNRIGHLEKLARAGVEVYRTLDAGWLDWVRDHAPRLYPVGNLLDKILPVTPPLVAAQARDHDGHRAVALPSSTLLIGRNGLRRLALPAVSKLRWLRALDRAARQGGVFHAWFHPSNFYFDAETQFSILETVFRAAARKRDAGALRIATMADFAEAPP
jgi:hypothetical protein